MSAQGLGRAKRCCRCSRFIDLIAYVSSVEESWKRVSVSDLLRVSRPQEAKAMTRRRDSQIPAAAADLGSALGCAENR